MDLLAQHVGRPARTVRSGNLNRHCFGHVATLMQLSATFRAH
jgi:hypothetical protein